MADETRSAARTPLPAVRWREATPEEWAMSPAGALARAAAEAPFWRATSHGIVGLAPGPWDAHDGLHWPTDGYDGALVRYDWPAATARPDDPFAFTGHPREEWLALADEMIARWAAWRAYIATLSAPPEAGRTTVPGGA